MKEEKLIRFVNNRTSPEENMEVMEWLSKNGAEEHFIKMLQKTWNSETSDQVNESKQLQILENIHKATLKSRQTHGGRQISPYWIKYGKVAATFLLFAFSAYFLFMEYTPQEKESIVVEVQATKITKHVGAGEKLKLVLPDKSEVIINSLSTLSFASDFGNINREVELDGEAYFSVSPDKNKPFQVKTGTVTTTALGTAFNALTRDSEVIISLTEGKVNVAVENQTVSLDPGEMASFHESDSRGLTKGKFDPVNTTLWKEGKIQFQGTPFKEILNSLEKWYGVRFETSANVNRKVTGLFNNESLEDILTGLSFSLDFDYEINQKDVVIKF